MRTTNYSRSDFFSSRPPTDGQMIRVKAPLTRLRFTYTPPTPNIQSWFPPSPPPLNHDRFWHFLDYKARPVLACLLAACEDARNIAAARRSLSPFEYSIFETFLTRTSPTRAPTLRPGSPSDERNKNRELTIHGKRWIPLELSYEQKERSVCVTAYPFKLYRATVRRGSKCSKPTAFSRPS